MFVVPEHPSNEESRLAFLYSCGILDTPKDERFDRVTRLASYIYDAEVAYLGFVDDRYQWLKATEGEGLAPFFDRDKTICQFVISSGRPLVIGDMKADTRLQGHPLVPQLPFRFYAGVPLLTEDGEAIASLCVLKQEPQDETNFDLGPLTDLSSIAMNELELWRRNQNLARLTETDGLTGIMNRRGFDAALAKAVSRANRTQNPVALLLIDLDHFKLLNDTMGHQAGDDVLRRFASLLSAAARRPDDIAARYGGEEFALILPDTDIGGAVEVAESLHQAIASMAYAHPQGIGGLVTASIGISCLVADAAEGPEILIARADAALYKAKRSGRNKTEIFPPVQV